MRVLLHPAQLPAYLPEPRGEEDGSKQTPTRAWRWQGRAGGGGSRVSRGWQVPLHSTDHQRRFWVPPSCPQLRSGAPHRFHANTRAPPHPTVQPWGTMLLRSRFECVLTHTCMRSRASRAFHGQPGRHQPVLPACATLQDELPLARGHGEAAGPLRDYSPTAAGWGCSLIPGQNWSLSHPVPSQGTGAHTHPSLCAAGHHPRPANPAHPTTPQTKDIPRAFPRSKAPSRLCPAPLVHLSPPEHP